MGWGEDPPIPVGGRATEGWFIPYPDTSSDPGTMIVQLEAMLLQKDSMDAANREYYPEKMGAKRAYINLNEHLGLDYFGNFDANGSGFYRVVKSNGWTAKIVGGWNLAVFDGDGVEKGSINLNLFVVATDKNLYWRLPSENITESGWGWEFEAVSGSVTDDFDDRRYNGVLRGALLGHDGRYHEVKIDVAAEIGVKDGKFVEGYGFPDMCLDGRYEIDMEYPTKLVARVWDGEKIGSEGGKYVNAEIDLSTKFANVGGALTRKNDPGLLDQDGSLTLFLESFPYVCWFTVVVHIGWGNMNAAQRAMAKSVYSMTVFSASVAAGIVSTPVGAVVGAAIGTQIGLGAQEMIRKATGASVEPLSVKMWAKETFVNTVAAGAGGGIAKVAGLTAKKLAAQKLAEKSVEVVGKLTEEGVDKLGGAFVSMAVADITSSFTELV